MKSFLERKPQIFVLLFVLFVVGTVSSPFWAWHLKPEQTLDMLIVDKTVPDTTYREHKGLMWVLNNERYIQKGGQPYSAAKDYFGFKHQAANSYQTDELPENLDSYQVLYLADLYGVYESEYRGTNEAGNRSRQLYGGLQEDEVVKLETAVMNGNKTLIAEFNTFGSPTEEDVRKRMTNLLNVNWSGWTGRYFTDLNGKEVPQWIIDKYNSQQKEWRFPGAGFVFVNEEDFIAVIGEADLDGEGLDFVLTDEGEKSFHSNLSSTYTYWFDIIQPLDEQEVLATYELPLKKQAKEKLAGYGIPAEFPAVVKHRNKKYTAYYFAGDYADEAEVPGIYKTAGLSSWKKLTGGEKSFYWKTYVPMVKEILADGLHKKREQELPVKTVNDQVQFNSRTGKDSIQIQKEGKWEDFVIKGVNVGIAKPGAFPGETAITKEEYLCWFKLIGGMNANAIRVYTLHPPQFYEAFHEYNQLAAEPLYLFHGAWANEEMLVGSQDAFSNEVSSDFQREIKQMIDIIHGNAEIAPSKGHASGKYSHDISPYVLGFILGIEWDPSVVLNTNQVYQGMEQFTGQYFETKGAEAFEIWLAKMMEFTADYETKHYNWQHTISFTNWVTTDLLEHPSEPLETEDMVSVNPNTISKTARFNGGMFASYHVYPYYPDFLSYEKKYLEYIDKRGEKNHYAGYLNDLISAHSMPVLIAEFGVPASRGLTHRSVSGMNQGFLSEKQQGEMNRELFRTIVGEGSAGGLVFSWQDEWFKRTWNTMDYDNPERRPFWANHQTNEQNFGLLRFEAGKKSSSLLVDGRSGDWEKKGIKPAEEAKGFLKRAYVTSDEGYLYIRIDFSKTVDWENQNTFLFIDSIPNQGQHNLNLNNEMSLRSGFGTDFMVQLAGPENSRILVDSYYDPFYFQYGKTLNMIPKMRYAEQKNNGIFHPIRLALNKEMVLPSENRKIPFQSYETGVLKYGTANPDDKDFNSLTDISISENKKMIEIRIPWQLLNVKDPSSKEIITDLYKKGLEKSERITGFDFAAVSVERGQITGTLPELNGNASELDKTFRYEWKEWEQPQYYERLKQSYKIMSDAFKETGSKGEKSE